MVPREIRGQANPIRSSARPLKHLSHHRKQEEEGEQIEIHSRTADQKVGVEDRTWPAAPLLAGRRGLCIHTEWVMHSDPLHLRNDGCLPVVSTEGGVAQLPEGAVMRARYRLMAVVVVLAGIWLGVGVWILWRHHVL